MATYGNAKNLTQAPALQQVKFTKAQGLSEKPHGPGIYKCSSCGFEDVMNRDCDKLPPCSNCKKPGHSNDWLLIVRAEDK